MYDFLHCFSMKGWDPEGLTGPRKPLPDSVTIQEPAEDKLVTEPSSEQRDPVSVSIPAEDSYVIPADTSYQQEPYEQPSF